MNRAERRAAARANPSWLPDSYAERVRRLMKNGITQQDLEKMYRKGFDDGFAAAGQPMVKTCYAAAALAAHDMYGFGKKRCKRLLKSLDKHVLNTLTSVEAIEEVYKKVGLHIDFNDPFERIADENGN